MATFNVYNLEGTKTGTVTRPAIFDVPVDEKLIHRYQIWVGTVLRDSVAHTKTRAEVSGGGRKPWKQKGTGRARTGSTRNPLWRHGGIIFGPRNDRSFATRMPRTERRKALLSALSSKSADVIVLEKENNEKPNTKDFQTLLSKLPIKEKQKVLRILPTYNATAFKAADNISFVTSRTVSRLNINDLLNNDVLLLSKDGLAALEQQFTPTV